MLDRPPLQPNQKWLGLESGEQGYVDSFYKHTMTGRASTNKIRKVAFVFEYFSSGSERSIAGA
ncbi:MAG TPA: hypothetical protein DDZ51_07880 [Planctomycetaceae bacterium]|nr:hypothetical protein [Planctomycetaceae bacterium]